jgi:hypothetical protein
MHQLKLVEITGSVRLLMSAWTTTGGFSTFSSSGLHFTLLGVTSVILVELESKRFRRNATDDHSHVLKIHKV